MGRPLLHIDQLVPSGPQMIAPSTQGLPGTYRALSSSSAPATLASFSEWATAVGTVATRAASVPNDEATTLADEDAAGVLPTT